MRGIVITSVLLAVVVNQANAAGATHGAECSSDTPCDTAKHLTCTVSYTQCGTTGVCTCTASKPYWSATDDTCKAETVKGDACNNDDDCMGAMTCDGSSLCVCADRLAHLSCEGALGEACTGTNDDTCFDIMECPVAAICTCPANTFDDGSGYCREHYHGETCTTNSDCQGMHVVCDTTAGKCACDTNYLVLSDSRYGCTADGAKLAEATCSSADEAGNDECKGTMVCSKCGTTGSFQCLTPGSPNSAGKPKALMTTGILLLLASGISFLY